MIALIFAVTLFTQTEGGAVSLNHGLTRDECENTICQIKNGESCAAHAKRVQDEMARRAKTITAAIKKLGCLSRKPKETITSVPTSFFEGVYLDYRETPHHYWCPVESGAYAAGIGVAVSPTEIKRAECIE
jgi:hypothetical protein